MRVQVQITVDKTVDYVTDDGGPVNSQHDVVDEAKTGIESAV